MLLGSAHVQMDLSKFAGYKIPPKQLRLPSAIRSPETARPRRPTPHSSPLTHRRKNGRPRPTRRAGGVGRPSRRRIARSPEWRGIVKKKEIPVYDTATRFVSTHLLLYYCIAVARSWVGKLVRRWVVGSVGGWTSERVCGFRCLTCFALLFAGSMVLSPLDDGALRTNWIHICCCTLLLYCCSTW